MKIFNPRTLIVLLFLLTSNYAFSQKDSIVLNECYIDRVSGYVTFIQKYTSEKEMNEFNKKFQDGLVLAKFSYYNHQINRTRPDIISIDTNGRKKANYMYKFEKPDIEQMADLKIVLLIDNIKYEFISSVTEPIKFNIDLKPSFDKDKPQCMDIGFQRKFALNSNSHNFNQFDLSAKAYLSSKPDLNNLRSININFGYQYLFSQVGEFKFVGLSGKIGTEHPQDFSQTNMVGSLVFSTVIPYSDLIIRKLTGNVTDACLGVLLEPEIQFVKNTSFADSNYLRLALHGACNIPLLPGQYAKFYGIAFFQKDFIPRSYIEATIEQKINPSLYLIAKWVNGMLPPLFIRESDLRIGIRIQ